MSYPHPHQIACDQCGVLHWISENHEKHNLILRCQDCERDLCRTCREASRHVVLKEADGEEFDLIGCNGPRCSWCNMLIEEPEDGEEFCSRECALAEEGRL